MSHVRSWFGVALAAGFATACAPKEPPAPPAPPAVDSTQVKAAVDGLWKQWITADTSGSISAMTALVADSIRIDNRGSPPIEGKAAWQGFAETMLKGVDVLSEVITPDVTIAVSNDLAYQNGSYVELTQAGKKKNTDYGRYAAAIQKGSDGAWRIRYIMAFSDSTVAAK
jgi:ketosteroid isomerase-like protein